MSRRNGDHPPLFEPGDRVAVLGLGRSGEAAARLVAALGGEVYASDAFTGETQDRAAAGLRDAGIEAESGGHDVSRILTSQLVVVSPGIDPSTEVRRAVRDAGVRTVAEVEVAFRSLQSNVIAITGTNGKTTATTLCGHLLTLGGLDAVAAGNIGHPLSEVALRDEQPEWVAVELSSFQLADMDAFGPDVGVLLNLSPDHLDRYDTLESYYADKRRFFANATPESQWVVNADDSAVMEMVERVPGRVVPASVESRVEQGAFLDEDSWLTLSLEDRRDRWLRTDELRLLGRHNALNALMAGAAVALAGCDPAAIGEGLRTFEPLPHRLQPIGEFEGVLWVNDSKATNVAATREAIRAFDRPVVVTLGGRHKGEPYGALLPELREHARGVVAFGEAAALIAADLGDEIPLYVVKTLGAVVRAATDIAKAGDVVVFSPACSSYDMFENYEARGRAFEAAVHGMYDQEGGA
jgi:UDP-N-acetylmuramoylalanine--D-glutamate ligase